MKSKVITIIVAIILLGIGVWGGYLLMEKQQLDVIVTNRENSDEIANIEDEIEDIVQEKINQELEYQKLLLEEGDAQINTYKSIFKNYPDNFYEIIEKYSIDGGLESAAWEEVESNYYQYESKDSYYIYDEMNDNYYSKDILKYTNPINIKLARMHEDTYNLIEDCLESEFSSLSEDEIARLKKEVNIDWNQEIYELNNEFYGLPLDELVRIQSEFSRDALGEKIGKDGFFKITGMLIMNGNNSSEAEWKNNSRAKKIKVIINENEEYIYNLDDTSEVQLIDLNYTQNNTAKPINVEIKILEKYNGDISEDVYISDIRLGLDSSISGGR